MRQYQQRNLRYGTEQAEFELPVRKFFPIYLKCFGLALAAVIVMFIVVALIGVIVATTGGKNAGAMVGGLTAVFAGLGTIYIIYLFVLPYMQTRIANLVWSNTRFNGLEINCTMGARKFMWLQTKNVVFTLLTLGLYRPFAVVKVYEFRLANVTLSAPFGVDHCVGQAARPASAASDGVADFLGVDLSW
jgi:uncharacterized membrane protein YjgN (DUF898 family)